MSPTRLQLVLLSLVAWEATVRSRVIHPRARDRGCHRAVRTAVRPRHLDPQAVTDTQADIAHGRGPFDQPLRKAWPGSSPLQLICPRHVMPRVALCISGGLRSFLTPALLAGLRDDMIAPAGANSTDVFIYTTNTTERFQKMAAQGT